MDSALIATLVNLGAGFIVVILMLLGFLVPKWVVDRLVKENEDLKTALSLERRGHDDAASTASVFLQIMTAMRSVAERRDERDQDREFGEPGSDGKDAEV